MSYIDTDWVKSNKMTSEITKIMEDGHAPSTYLNLTPWQRFDATLEKINGMRLLLAAVDPRSNKAILEKRRHAIPDGLKNRIPAEDCGRLELVWGPWVSSTVLSCSQRCSAFFVGPRPCHKRLHSPDCIQLRTCRLLWTGLEEDLIATDYLRAVVTACSAR